MARHNIVYVDIRYLVNHSSPAEDEAALQYIVELNRLMVQHIPLAPLAHEPIYPTKSPIITDEVTGDISRYYTIQLKFPIVKPVSGDAYPYMNLHYLLKSIVALGTSFEGRVNTHITSVDLSSFNRPWIVVTGKGEFFARPGIASHQFVGDLLPETIVALDGTHFRLDALSVWGEPNAVAAFKAAWSYGKPHKPLRSLASFKAAHPKLQWHNIVLWGYNQHQGTVALSLDGSNPNDVLAVNYAAACAKDLAEQPLTTHLNIGNLTASERIFLDGMDYLALQPQTQPTE